MSRHLGFIGAGQMAQALASGFISSGQVTADAVTASDIAPDVLSAFHEKTGAKTTEKSSEVLTNSDIIILAVKPQVLPKVAETIDTNALAGKLLVSIAAGVTLEKLANLFGDKTPMIRVMPNTPCMVGRILRSRLLRQAIFREDW